MSSLIETYLDNLNLMDGWCTKEKADAIYSISKKSIIDYGDDFIAVELGVFGGRSLLPFAIAAKEFERGKVFGIDPYDNNACLEGINDTKNNVWWQSLDLDYVYRKALSFIDKYELSDFCTIERIRSDFGASLFKDDSISIIHQDSVHNTDVIVSELNLWIPKLRSGGYWIVDDTDWEETLEGYSKLKDYGLTLIQDFKSWQVWQKK